MANGGISKDGLTVTYHLRSGLRFADGFPLTARDCVYSVEAILNRRNDVSARPDTRYRQGRSARRLDIRSPPAAPVCSGRRNGFSAERYPIYPAHLLERYPDFNQIPFDATPVGSGPYVVERWVRGDRLVLHSNPFYAGGKPDIDELEIRFVPNEGTILNLLRTREIDGAFNVGYGLVSQLRDVAGLRVMLVPSNAAGSLIFNTTDPLTNDASVRHALAEAIDFRSAVMKSFQGVSTRAMPRRRHPVGLRSGCLAADPFRSERRPATYRGGLGWKPGPDGILVKGGRRAKGTLTLVVGQCQRCRIREHGRLVRACCRR